MIRAALILALWSTGASALTLELPPPAQKVETVSQSGAVALPSGAWRDGGSYPAWGGKGYQVSIVLRSADADALEAAMQDLRTHFPEGRE